MQDTKKPAAKNRVVITRYHVIVAILTFLAYVMVRANRKSFSNVKVLIAEEWSPSLHNVTVRTKEPAAIWSQHNFFASRNDRNCKTFLGVLDTVFLVTYSVALYVGGILGDRLNLRYLLSASLMGTSATLVLFLCLPEWIGLYSIPWYIIFCILNGLFQGPVWPCLLAVMNNWFDKSHQGLIFGIWSSNASLGNVIGSLLIAGFVDYGYDMAVVVTAIVQFALTIIIFFGLVISPAEVGITLPEDVEEEKIATSIKECPTAETVLEEQQEKLLKEKIPTVFEVMEVKEQQTKAKKAVGFVEALCLPGVVIYALSYACLKLVNYALYFWLPFYLNRRFHWSQADSDSLSTWFDVGGVAGGIGLGFVCDRFNRPGVMFISLVASLPVVSMYNFLPDNKPLNACVLFLIGFFVSGVAHILSGAVAADLSRHPKLNSSKAALATISGIIEGTGSAVAAIGQLAIPLIETALGWASVFWMLVICVILTCIGVGRMLYNDLRRSRRFGKTCHCCYKVNAAIPTNCE